MNVGTKIVAIYTGEGKTEPSRYRGTIETIKFPKNGKGQMIIIRLDNDEGYRSIYTDKAQIEIEA